MIIMTGQITRTAAPLIGWMNTVVTETSLKERLAIGDVPALPAMIIMAGRIMALPAWEKINIVLQVRVFLVLLLIKTVI